MKKRTPAALSGQAAVAISCYCRFTGNFDECRPLFKRGKDYSRRTAGLLNKPQFPFALRGRYRSPEPETNEVLWLSNAYNLHRAR